MRLVRAIFFFAAKNNCNILMRHIAGISNGLADSLSRLQVRRFKEELPTADQVQTSFPQTVWEV